MEYFVNACNLKATATEFIEFAKNELASFYKEVATVKKGAIELLDFLKEKGVKICLASATGLEEIKKVLAYHNLTSYFDSILSCAEVGVGKEKPDMVFTYTIKPNIYGALACAVRGIPCAPNITGLGTAVENGGKIQQIFFRNTFSKYNYKTKE
jgi:hypothetical protein